MARTVAERSDAIAPLAEVFREHGYEGASLSLISKATGLGKGSLYHFFPGGKEEMMAAVLADIDRWFERKIFAPLEATDEAEAAIAAMLAAVTAYFRTGQRVCLVGALGLSESGNRFAATLSGYFARWIDALVAALVTGGVPPALARDLSEDAVAGIQGAIVLSRAMGSPAVFERVVGQIAQRLAVALRR
ncbi:TetR/AcrR family transcriptional regulator [Jiella endophytica]|uniref:TetR/AcrR family transcriptional regulator n=1 Tax=Jiella endophytica TaxID=2558362 RepID=A0A4Y8RIX5_9HYPH|nr:TetR/AcrR family transcriptional regulator [Jiella endophytica]TFF22944.1 TetR/AcrR family transcriptional regulator [Jiella endophytica]